MYNGFLLRSAHYGATAPGKGACSDDVLSALIALAAIVACCCCRPTTCWTKRTTRRSPSATVSRSGRLAWRAGRCRLCARCSGTYLGALAGLIVTGRARPRAGESAPRGQVPGGAGVLFARLGRGWRQLISDVLPGHCRHSYEPHNLLRLVTGTLEGLAIAAFLLPVLNLALWAASAAHAI